jgi:hypothetical protein
LAEYATRALRLSTEMKTILVTVSLALGGASSAEAQIFRPAVGNGAVVGAVAGGLIGGHNGDRWAEGAVIGAAAGALIGAALTPQQPVYSAPPAVYQAPIDYGQRVYPQSGTTVVHAAPGVYNAPMVSAAPTIVEQVPTQVVQTQPQVVYVESAPRVVYVPAPAPRVIYAAPPPVIGFGFGFGIHSGPRYYDHYRPYSYNRNYSHGHHNHGHRGHRR